MLRIKRHTTDWVITLILSLILLLAGSGFTISSNSPTEHSPKKHLVRSVFATPIARVRAVLFWSPDCELCRQVVERDLPPLIDRYGEQLQILYMDINHPNGEIVYQAAIEKFEIEAPDLPLVVIDQTVLQGLNLTQQFTRLVDSHLQKGGVDWPDIPGLEMWLNALPDIMSQPLENAECSECELTATQSASNGINPVSKPLPAAAELTPAFPVVRAVMFWMNGCPHCHEVLDNVLPPIQAKYGAQFEIQLIELVGGQEVMALYEMAESMGIEKEDVGVPFLIIGEHVLIGSADIPYDLPPLIDQYLAAGGVDYPNSPALAPFLQSQANEEEICAPSEPCASEKQEIQSTPAPQAQRPTQTNVILPNTPAGPGGSNGFALAVVIMVGMTAALIYSGYAFIHQLLKQPLGNDAARTRNQPRLDWLTPLLVAIGLGVAGYLAYVETQSISAVCGPVGDCNTVQSSSYARLFGVLPIGVLGVIGYLVILAAWIFRRWSVGRKTDLAAVAIFVVTFGGVLFSLYLTFLEPFVIKAVCMWCITTAVIMTLLLLLNGRPALQALGRLNWQDASKLTQRKQYAKEKTP